ncbi:MAG TPA: hypothetical protein VGF34_21030 [Stellaceae bacterium]
MHTLRLAAAAVAIAATAASSAFAGVSLQGPQLTGVALQSLIVHQPVTEVTLPSGEIINLHRRVGR